MFYLFVLLKCLLDSLAAGSFLYVALVDILGEEFANPGKWKRR